MTGDPSVRGLQDRHERLLGDRDVADHFHPPLSLLLLLQQLSLPRDIAPVALRSHVLTKRADGLAGDNLGTNGSLLDDPRVETAVCDVYKCIRDATEEKFDAILLDVDNGPTSLVQPQYSRLYKDSGFASIMRSLRVGGKVAFWSAEPEPRFMRQLRKAGFRVTEVPAKAHPRAKRAAHRIYVGEKT